MTDLSNARNSRAHPAEYWFHRMARKSPQYLVDVVAVLAIFLAGLVHYGDLYKKNEKNFNFYQKYFYSAVNIYCVKDPDIRKYNWPPDQVRNERIDLESISCDELERSPKLERSYYNGWHDTHPILSTLIGYAWRLGNFRWESLWPIVGSLAALTVLAFYLILRCFGLSWYAALLIFPATVPFNVLEQNLYFLRDFSKVPFILIAFAPLGVLFKSGISYKLRVSVLAAATCIAAIGVGFRQDSVVIIPAILAGAAFSSTINSRTGVLRFTGEVAVVFLSFYVANSLFGLLRTSQLAELQGYPHFIVQGFADPFWAASRTEIPGLSFLALYSDPLAWAAVDANSSEQVPYFADMHPAYAHSGLNLVVKFASLSAGDMVTRVFQGLSAISHGSWIVKPLGIWLGLFLALIVVGKWRLSFFLMVTILSLAAAGSIQFSSRHILHLIMLDRVVLIIVLASLLGAIWQFLTFRFDLKFRLAAYSGLLGAGLVIAIVAGTFLIQRASLNTLKRELEALPWSSSQEAYSKRFPNNSEAVLRFTIDGSRCFGGKLEAVLEMEGQRLLRPLDVLEGAPRSVYFAVYNPAIEILLVDVTPHDCVIERSWAPLGDGSIPPVQFFDPEVALRRQTLMRHLENLASSLL